MRVSENPEFDADFKTLKKLQNYTASDTIRLYISIYILWGAHVNWEPDARSIKVFFFHTT
jgi:hypothetical protein